MSDSTQSAGQESEEPVPPDRPWPPRGCLLVVLILAVGLARFPGGQAFDTLWQMPVAGAAVVFLVMFLTWSLRRVFFPSRQPSTDASGTESVS